MKRCLQVALPLLLIVLLTAAALHGLASVQTAVWPDSAGSVRDTNGKLLMDASHSDQGYVMLCVTKPTKHAMKVRISKDSTQLMYDLNNKGDWETFPLQLGSGSYTIELFENVKGSKYSAEGKIKLKAQLNDENAAFLVPNQYVMYTSETEAAQKSDELCNGATGKAAFDIITKFISDEFRYDFVRAATISAHELPDVDGCYATRSGICQDLAAVMCTMLRVQGVPAKLMIGYADKYYHAWTVCVVDGKEVFFDPTAAIGAMNAKKYSVERCY